MDGHHLSKGDQVLAVLDDCFSLTEKFVSILGLADFISAASVQSSTALTAELFEMLPNVKALRMSGLGFSLFYININIEVLNSDDQFKGKFRSCTFSDLYLQWFVANSTNKQSVQMDDEREESFSLTGYQSELLFALRNAITTPFVLNSLSSATVNGANGVGNRMGNGLTDSATGFVDLAYRSPEDIFAAGGSDSENNMQHVISVLDGIIGTIESLSNVCPRPEEEAEVETSISRVEDVEHDVLLFDMASPSHGISHHSSSSRDLFEAMTSSKRVIFGTNIDIGDWTEYMDMLRSGFPSFLWCQGESDVLRLLRQTVEGMSSPQIYVKMPGVWTGGHEENNR